MTDPLVVSNLKKTYLYQGKKIEALKGISFSVKQGEVLGLLGPNGAGKTTTVNILTGLLTADSGDVKFFGENANDFTRNRISTATAYNSLDRHITVERNLRVYALIYGVKDISKRIDMLLELFDIEELRRRRVQDLSTGQKTRVNLCKAFISDPDLVFLDESTSGLDPDIASVVRQQIKSLGKTVVFTSHIMSEVEELCDRIVFLSKGEILKIDTPANLKKLIDTSTYVFEFLSEPEKADDILKKFSVEYRKRNVVAIKLKQKQNLQLVIKHLTVKGFVIEDMHVKKPSLDDVFIKVARGEL